MPSLEKIKKLISEAIAAKSEHEVQYRLLDILIDNFIQLLHLNSRKEYQQLNDIAFHAALLQKEKNLNDPELLKTIKERENFGSEEAVKQVLSNFKFELVLKERELTDKLQSSIGPEALMENFEKYFDFLRTIKARAEKDFQLAEKEGRDPKWGMPKENIEFAVMREMRKIISEKKAEQEPTSEFKNK